LAKFQICFFIPSAAVAEKFLGEVGQFSIFFAFPAQFFLTKLFITFDRLHRSYRMIACFEGYSMGVNPASLKIYTVKIFWVVESCPNVSPEISRERPNGLF
jgi:hypothetical protein